MVIAGTDFSVAAARAVGEARILAARLQAPIEIVYVHPSLRSGSWLPDRDAQRWMTALGIDVASVTIRTGTPWVELVRFADERDAQLIVVGTHGQSGFQPVALGSTAARLAVVSSRPTLLVGESQNRRGRRPTVVAGELFENLER